MAGVIKPEKLFPHVFLDETGQVRLHGTGLTVWEVVRLARDFDGNVYSLAEHLDISPDLVDEALRYAALHPTLLDRALQDGDSFTLARLQALLPNLEVLDLPLMDEPR